MKKAAVIYASVTGNTEIMAQAVLEGVQGSGVESVIADAGSMSAEEALTYDILLLGSPAMGAEVLEEEKMEPFFTSIESRLAGKTVALFGSYDWGDGKWMRDWEDRVRASGARLINNQGLTVNLTPGDEEKEQCRTLGKAAAEA
jgi:flavodoxin short chain